MGWGSGSQLARELWDELRLIIPEDKQRRAARAIWEAFRGHDCDTLHEAENLAVAAGYDWVDWDCLDDDECGKWGCMRPAIGNGKEPCYGDTTQACEVHCGELTDFERDAR